MIARFLAFLIKTGIAVIFMCWAIGFASYIGTVTAYTQPEINVNMPRTHAIVVLTGGSERLKAGANLLMAGKGEKLLFTGVNPEVKASSVLREDVIPEKVQKCCVTLGRAAGDTYGNADEAKAFLEENGYRSMTLVTSHYHMPRSLLAFERTMPDMKIIPYPVAPASVNLSEWWNSSGTLRLLVEEYSKYAWVWVKAKLESQTYVKI